MARPIKKGIDYFSFDTDFFTDLKIRKIKGACGPTSTSILICLLCNIYRNEGYYILWDEDLAFVISETIGVTEGAVNEVINKALQVNFFSKEKNEQYHILTSSGIQSRYLVASARRENVVIDSRYRVIAYNNPIPDNNNPPKESKVKESIGKEKDTKVSSPSIPQGIGGGDFLSSSLSKKDGIPRNYEGLLDSLKRLNISSKELDQISSLSNYGAIGNPVWGYVQQCLDSINKSTYDKSRIRVPGRYIISKMKEEHGT